LEVATGIIYDEVVERCRQGDASAYSVLYKRYSKAMFNTSLRIVNNTADAEDVLQEAFTDAFEGLKNFNFSSTFGAWLKKIVINKSLNVLRKKKLLLIDTDDEAIQELKTEELPDESYLLLQVAKIKKAMQTLDSGYRSVLSLYLFEGYDHEEISEIMSVPPSTVRSQYMRARQKLVTLLNKAG
jgi:RNA polymerase sigma-70 factor (ECF subfamily)